MSENLPTERARELGRENNFLTLCRIGFVGRGVLYILTALLALRTGRTEDLTGALAYLNEGSGQLLLVGIAAGMLAYGLWRLADAAFGMENPGDDTKALILRAGAGLAGSIYLYLSYKAVTLLLAGQSALRSPAQQADTVLDLPGGHLVLGLAALVLLAAGATQLRRAFSCSFLRRLDGRARAPLVKWLGRIGYAARGVIFLILALLIGRAAIDGRSDEVGGMEKALDVLSGPTLYAVALGLLLFGAFSIVEAAFRRIHAPPIDELKQLGERVSGYTKGQLDSAGERTYLEQMPQLDLQAKLAILADAAKYDASCSSSGTSKRDSRGGRGVGSTEGMGICHAYAPDGRCISLLKILLTNSCIFDCHYCINRKSSNVRRARFTAQEVVRLTLAFYKRNYIEGLFLSSGIIRSSNYTMEQIVEVARSLREDHDFRGYIHLKTIPDADPELVRLAGLHADRVSINVELPTEQGLARLAPEKSAGRIEGAMAAMKSDIEAAGDERRRFKSAPGFAPAGQSTQMIVGADAASDTDIVARSSTLYDRFKLRRVYYLAFSPIPDASAVLPLRRPPLMREHRLYQSDWLMRFYGFKAGEVAAAADEKGMLPLDIDPKLAWALKFRDSFPVDVNSAPRELLLRVPGLGTRAIAKILTSRRFRRLRLEDVARLTVSIVKVRPFIVTADWRPTLLIDRSDLKALVAPKRHQLELFAA